ncbi:hypothetical protein GTA08_BOTSDO04925 [Neofusicoccum parvum]|uniref:Uncharacterized protein n=1 Tax=Neofusicoccum parvum TaxID=310453 RepID=A0ACB5SRH5_9PEZI|nr:hypothetical protein GTA08_BOTSDO04925 [Neofusicoccum parvum]
MATESATFDLPDLIHQQVLAEWTDGETGETCTLGSLSSINKQDAGLAFRIGLDDSLEQAFVRLSMDVSLRVSGRPRRRQLLYVVPLHVLSHKSPAFEYEVLRTSDIGTLAPVVHDAGFSDSGFVIRAQVNLRDKGYVLMPRSNAKALRPSTSTAASHLAGMMSLSQALSFTLYLKPSDIAEQGMGMMYELLRNDTLKQYPLQWDAMYGNHGAQLVDWGQSELDGKGKAPEVLDEELEPPPPYVSGPQDDAPRTPSPPLFAFPPSQPLLPSLLLSPTQCTSSLELQVGRSTNHSSPQESLSAAGSQACESDVLTIPATPDCLPEIRALLSAQAAARERERERALHRTTTTTTATTSSAFSPAHPGRKRRASASPITSPITIAAAAATTTTNLQPTSTRKAPLKRVCTTDDHALTAPHPQPPSPVLYWNTSLASPAYPPTPCFPGSSTSPAALASPALPAAPAAPSAQTNPPSENTLLLTIATWTAKALALNPRVYRHSQLQQPLLALGRAARTGDAPAFRALRARVSAAFFLDPRDKGVAVGEACRKDIEELVEWMLGVDGLADVVCWRELVGLGEAVRGGAGAEEEVNWRKGVVVGSLRDTRIARLIKSGELHSLDRIGDAFENIDSFTRTLDFPKLAYVGGSIKFTESDQYRSGLQRASMPSLKEVNGDLLVTGNHHFSELTIPNIERINGLFHIVNELQLSNLSLDKLETVGPGGIELAGSFSE